jgi:dienelactone hydrolase
LNFKRGYMAAAYPHMVHDYYVERFRQVQDQRRIRLAALRHRQDALAYQQRVRRAIARSLGPRPAKTPLNARVTGHIDAGHCRIEKVLFESRPGCLVSANLYLPKQIDTKIPAVIGSCGHSDAGKAEPAYQDFCRRLTHAGFAVLIYDPFNQGERDQYHRLRHRQEVRSCTHAHNMMGKQLELSGEWFGTWRAWDGIRALDYLLTRPEIDRHRVGLTGNSGGGTMTTWMWAAERRFTMAAPSCFVTTFLHNLENELPADCEQYPPGVVGAGLDMADFFIARAPDPVLLMGQRYDFFDRRGLQQAYKEIEHFYRLLDAPRQATELFIGPQGHGYSSHNQEAMVSFFAAQAELPDPKRRRSRPALERQALDATPKGNTIAAGAVPIYTLGNQIAQDWRRQRQTLGEDDLRRALTRLLHLPRHRSIPHYRVLRPLRLEGHTYGRYAVETEANIRALLSKRLDQPRHAYSLDVEEKQVHLYLPHLAADEDLSLDSLAQQVAADHPLYTLDPRGLGQSSPTGADFLHPYGMDYMLHGHALLLGENYLGRRVYDVLRCIDLLVAEGAQKVHLYGRGQGAILALFSALLHPRVAKIQLKNAPLSFEAWTQAPLVAWPAASGLVASLRHFDLGDCYRALGRRLSLLQPWGPDMKPLSGKALAAAIKDIGLPASTFKSP